MPARCALLDRSPVTANEHVITQSGFSLTWTIQGQKLWSGKSQRF